MVFCSECRLLSRSWLITMLMTLFAIMGYDIPVIASVVLIALPAVVSLRTVFSAAEFISLFAPVILLSFFSINPYAPICCTAAYVFMILTVRSGRRWTAAVSIVIVCVLGAKAAVNPLSWADIVYLTCAALTILLNLPLLFYKKTPCNAIKIYADDSDKLREGLKIFTAAAKKEGAAITEESADVVIAFKPENFGVSYKFWKDTFAQLPKSRGGKAFILYTARFYPDMPYLVLWVALTLKGWRVMGRTYITTGHDKFTEESGGDFAAGFKCGLPPLVTASPLLLLGLTNFIKK